MTDESSTVGHQSGNVGKTQLLVDGPQFKPYMYELTSSVWVQMASMRVCLAGLLPCASGGFTSTVTETGSRMERAVSSSFERLQEKSSKPSMEQ